MESRILCLTSTVTTTARCGCVHYNSWHQLSNHFSNLILSLVTKRRRTILVNVRHPRWPPVAMLTKVVYWSEMANNMMENYIWTSKIGIYSQFVENKWPPATILWKTSIGSYFENIFFCLKLHIDPKWREIRSNLISAIHNCRRWPFCK